MRADLSLGSDLVLGLLPWFGSDQLQQTILIQDLCTETLRLSINIHIIFNGQIQVQYK